MRANVYTQTIHDLYNIFLLYKIRTVKDTVYHLTACTLISAINQMRTENGGVFFSVPLAFVDATENHDEEEDPRHHQDSDEQARVLLLCKHNCSHQLTIKYSVLSAVT